MVGISTSVFKDFQFTSGGFNGFSHQDGIKNLGILIYQNFFCPMTCDLRFYIISHPYHFYCSYHIHFQIALRRYQGPTLIFSIVSWFFRAGTLYAVGYLAASRLWKRQTFPTSRGSFYSLLHSVTFVPFPSSLHHGYYSLRSEPLVWEVLYATFFLTSCVCSSIVDQDRLFFTTVDLSGPYHFSRCEILVPSVLV